MDIITLCLAKKLGGGSGGGMTIHPCVSGEYDTTTWVPTIQNPDASTIYLVPASDWGTNDLYIEWYYVDNAWEQFGRAKIDVSGKADKVSGATNGNFAALDSNGNLTDSGHKHGDYPTDVQVNGTSVVVSASGVANVPAADTTTYGVIRLASEYDIKNTTQDRPAAAKNQHKSTFYGLAKAAGDSTQPQSANAVGTYTETAKSAISQMLNAPETVSGTTPSITAKSGVQYICGEVSTIDITVPESGIIDVIFESGSTPAVLTVTPPTGVTVVWPDWFDPTALEANKTYEVNISNGRLATVMVW